MLIEFYLDYDYILQIEYYLLLDAIDEWSRKNDIKYSIKRKNDILRLCFDDDKYYHWFVMSWPETKVRYKVVDSRTN
jgi:hypothetical protein